MVTLRWLIIINQLGEQTMNLISTLKKYLKNFFIRKLQDEDFSSFTSNISPTRKQFYLEECKKQNVSIYIDDSAEQSTGIYANLRAVASEAELECRLNAKEAIINAKKAISHSKLANVIALFALILSVIDLVKDYS
jgi:hypothetical protein